MPVWRSGREVEYQYTESDVNAALFDMPPSQVLAFQRMAYEAGLVSGVTGAIDASTIAAMREVMGTANVYGEDWNSSLARMRTTYAAIQEQEASGTTTQRPQFAGGSLFATPTFLAAPYLPPDYFTLTLVIEGLFAQHLNREPTREELAILTDKMAHLYRADYDAQYAAALEKFERSTDQSFEAHTTDTKRGREHERDVNAVTEAAAAGGGIDEDRVADADRDALARPDSLVEPPFEGDERVDVAASTIEFFKKKWGAELQYVQDIQDAMANDQMNTQTILGINALMGGPVNEL